MKPPQRLLRYPASARLFRYPASAETQVSKERGPDFLGPASEPPPPMSNFYFFPAALQTQPKQITGGKFFRPQISDLVMLSADHHQFGIHFFNDFSTTLQNDVTTTPGKLPPNPPSVVTSPKQHRASFHLLPIRTPGSARAAPSPPQRPPPPPVAPPPARWPFRLRRAALR